MLPAGGGGGGGGGDMWLVSGGGGHVVWRCSAEDVTGKSNETGAIGDVDCSAPQYIQVERLWLR